MRATFRWANQQPHIAIPLAAFAVGSLFLFAGWAIAGVDGFSIASGCVSVIGLGITAFAAAAIWQVRSRYVRIIRLRELLRRIIWIRTEIDGATKNKERQAIRDNLGRLHAILVEVELQIGISEDIQWMMNKLNEIEESDNRSLDRLVRESFPKLSRLIEQLELEVHREETGASHAGEG